MSLKLPPEYVNTPACDVYNLALPDSVFRTLTMLHGLAWQTKGERTPPTTVLELANLRGLRERQMYTHLGTLKDLRRIRVEKLGRGLIVIYPLRWGPGTALPLDERSSLTEAEIAHLTDTDKPPGEFTAKNYRTAKNCSKQHVVVDSGLKTSESASDSKQQHEQHGFTAKNCSEFGAGSGLNDPDVVSKHPQAPPITAKNCSKLIEGITAIFINDGDRPDVAGDKAAKLIEKYGVTCCARQLSYFPRRCELAQASADGLRNPSGLFIRSVQGAWTAPAQTQKKSSRTWYTQEEFDELIEH